MNNQHLLVLCWLQIGSDRKYEMISHSGSGGQDVTADKTRYNFYMASLYKIILIPN